MRIEGRNILDEGFGPANLRGEKGRFGNRQNVAALTDMIRQGAGEGFAAVGAKQSAISRGAGVVAQSMGNNTLEVQRILESTNDATRDEFKKLTELMANRIGATGKAQEKALKDIAVQMEKIKIVAGEEGENIANALGFDEANAQMQTKTTVAKAFVVDPIKNFLGQGEGQKGFFGDKGLAKPFAQLRASRNFDAKKIAAQQMAETGQVDALKGIGGGLDIENNTVPELLKEQKELLEEIRDGQTNSFGPMGFGGLFSALAPLAALAGIAIAIDKIVGFFGGDDNDVAAAQIGTGLGIGQARNALTNRPPPDPELKPGVRRNSAGRLINESGRFIAEADAVAPPKTPGLGSRMMSGVSKVLGSRIVSRGLPVLGVAAEGLNAYKTVGEADAALAAGEITEEEHRAILENLAGETTGRIGGAFAGGAAGAKLGATVGAFGGPVGIAAGAVVGGAVGAIAGSALGESIGTMFAETPEEAAFEEAKEKGLYVENFFRKSEINDNLLKEETNPRILQAIINDDDLTEEDMLKVQERLAELQSSTSATDISSITSPTMDPSTIEPSLVPTGNAVENVTTAATGEGGGSVAPVINNITNNNNNSSNTSPTNIFASNVRNVGSSLQRYNDRVFMG